MGKIILSVLFASLVLIACGVIYVENKKQDTMMLCVSIHSPAECGKLK